MSKYTIQLRWIVEQELDDQGAPHIQSNWPLVYARLGLAATGNVHGLDGYPVASEARRQSINDMIIKLYYQREIGAETAGQFAWRMNETMCRIMPYYNALYEAKVIDASHLVGADYTDTVNALEDALKNGSSTGKSTGTGTSTAHSETGDNFTGRSLDTPEGQIALLDDGYLTRAEKTESSGTGDNNTTSESTADTSSTMTEDTNKKRTEERTGRRFDPTQYGQLLTIGRELLNIDRMIAESDEVAENFMLIW